MPHLLCDSCIDFFFNASGRLENSSCATFSLVSLAFSSHQRQCLVKSGGEGGVAGAGDSKVGEWQRDIESLRGRIEQSQRRGRTDEVLRRRLEQILPPEPELSDTGYTSEEDRGRSRPESEDESEETSLRSKNRSHDVSTDDA
ncbi:hypothetical protein L914_21567 [Phytophthora nicotianae]|uniref:Uncharacterized protein n=2 Tax=Phytophthora nicotianae TaxID=4792 RepID=V9DUT9_PHYNI|nr:hypothetical protein F443_22782 [Phytophthora nicotianae P1569]ETM30758.1 hypothetical protein L914_21567 [Phytophthora nicotianae]